MGKCRFSDFCNPSYAKSLFWGLQGTRNRLIFEARFQSPSRRSLLKIFGRFWGSPGYPFGSQLDLFFQTEKRVQKKSCEMGEMLQDGPAQSLREVIPRAQELREVTCIRNTPLGPSARWRILVRCRYHFASAPWSAQGSALDCLQVAHAVASYGRCKAN